MLREEAKDATGRFSSKMPTEEIANCTRILESGFQQGYIGAVRSNSFLVAVIATTTPPAAARFVLI